MRQKICKGMFSNLDAKSPSRVPEGDKENCISLANKQYCSRSTLEKTPGKPVSNKPAQTRHNVKHDSNTKSTEPIHEQEIITFSGIDKNKPSVKNDEMVVLLDRERRNVNDLKRRLNTDKANISNLKAKVKHLEDDNARLEDSHKRSLASIEQRVSLLKNTNLQLLNKAGKFEVFSKQLADVKDYRDSVNDDLR